MRTMRMRIKLKTAILGIVILSILLTAFYGSEVEAADQTAKLKSFLENNVLYYSTSVVSLNAEHRNSLTAFENKYKDNHVTVTGNILYNSVSKNYKEVWLYSDGERVLAKTSDKTILALAKKLKVGDTFTVYGEITGIKKDSFAIDVEIAVF